MWYHIYEAQMRASEPLRAAAQATLGLKSSLNGAVDNPAARQLLASLEMTSRATLTHTRPPFGIEPLVVAAVLELERPVGPGGDAEADAACEKICAAMAAVGLEPLYDDTDERAGAKFATQDLIGLPWRITVGPRGLKNGVVELTSRRSGESEEMPPEDAVRRLAEIYAGHMVRGL